MNTGNDLEYTKAHQKNVEGFRTILREAGNQSIEKKKLWEKVNAFYDDPDSYGVRTFAGISCTADALLSWKRIYTHEGFGNGFITTYEHFRRLPVLFFPTEWNGINMARYQAFRDRIDHAFLDLKNYYENPSLCKMTVAFSLPITKKWLEEMGSFAAIVDWLGVKGILTDDEYQVLDLSKADGTILKEYLSKEEYAREWSQDYYEMMKKVYNEIKMRKFHKQ